MVGLQKKTYIWDAIAEKLEDDQIEDVLQSLREKYLTLCEFNEPGNCGVILNFLNVLILDLKVNFTIEYLKSALLVFCNFEEEEINLFYEVYFICERFKIKELFHGSSSVELFSIDYLVEMTSKFLDCRKEDFFEFLFDAPSLPVSLVNHSEYIDQWNLPNNKENSKPSGSLNLSLFLFKYDIFCSLLKFGNKESNRNLSLADFNSIFQTAILNQKFYKVFKVLTDHLVKQSYINFLIEFCGIDYYNLYIFLNAVKNSKSIDFGELLKEFPNNIDDIVWLQFFDKDNTLRHFKLFDRLFLDYLFDSIVLNENKFLKRNSFLMNEYADDNGFIKSSKNSQSLWMHYKRDPYAIEKKLLTRRGYAERNNSDFIIHDFINTVFLKNISESTKPPNEIAIMYKRVILDNNESLNDCDISCIDTNEITLSKPLKFKVNYMDERSSNQFKFNYNINKFIQNICDDIQISKKQEQINETQILNIKKAFSRQKALNALPEPKFTKFDKQQRHKSTREIIILGSEKLELERSYNTDNDLCLQSLLDSLLDAGPMANCTTKLSANERNNLHLDHEESDLNALKEDLNMKNKRIKISMYESPKYKYYLQFQKPNTMGEVNFTPDMLLHAILQEYPKNFTSS